MSSTVARERHLDVIAGGAAPGGGDRKRRRWPVRAAVIGGAVAAVGIVAVGVVYYSPLLGVDEIVVTGQEQLPTETITGAAAIAKGSPLAGIDLDAAARRVEQVPSVASAVVSLDWPHTVTIAVAPRTAIAVTPSDQGFELVDADGVTFGAVAEAPADAPVIEAQPGVERSMAAAALAALPPETRAMVATVSVANTQIRMTLRDDKGAVRWGNDQDSVTKGKILATLLLANPDAMWFDVSVPAAPTTSEKEPSGSGGSATGGTSSGAGATGTTSDTAATGATTTGATSTGGGGVG